MNSNYKNLSRQVGTRRLITTLLLLFCFSVGLKAAHIVGGEISYVCLGGNNYEIKLRMYRDCGGGGAAFDAQIDIAVYDISNNLIKELTAPKGPTITVPATSTGTGNPCATAPPGSCTEYAEYKVTDNLPPLAGGYILTYQRCCRNSAIQNIPNPDDYGNTYTVTIPDNDNACNSTPQFIGNAPIALCINSPLNLALNVQEADGDSLHFELCDIFAGGRNTGLSTNCSDNGVTPSPACPPPYNVIPFIAPFSSTSPLSASPAFAIDPLAGVITGTPNQLGRYVVGICVSEYRDGALLSTVRLDYQFIVSNCVKTVVSDIVTPLEDPKILCDGFTVQFNSESTNTNAYFWDFGDTSTLADTSNLKSPTYTYPGPGKYLVMHIAEPNTVCADTVLVEFDLRNPVDPQFKYSGLTCFENQNIVFEVEGSYPMETTFFWEFGAANVPVFNGRTPPPIKWVKPGRHAVKLTVNNGTCSFVRTDTVEINELTALVDAGPDTTLYVGDILELNASDGVKWYWWADKDIELSSRISRQTSVLLKEADTIVFYVRVKDKLGCDGIDSLTVIILDTEVRGRINFFSPNGDGKNELFDLSDVNPNGDCFITIMNRWGVEVWNAENYANDWTGVDFNGKSLPDGTYYYILRCDKVVVYKSAITLVRGEN